MGALGKTETTFERRVAKLVDQFGESYPTYQYAFVDFIVEHLTDLSRSFEGDFQLFNENLAHGLNSCRDGRG